MTQGTDGVPVAIPVQTAGGIVPVHASCVYAQDGQVTSGLVPVEAVSCQPQIVVADSPVGTTYSPQETEMGSQHEKYIPLTEV